MQEAVAWLLQRIKDNKKTQVVTANAEIIMMGLQDPRYLDLLQKTDLVLADGAGTVWAGRTLGYTVPERVAGFDLFVQLLKQAAKTGRPSTCLGQHRALPRPPKPRPKKLLPG